MKNLSLLEEDEIAAGPFHLFTIWFEKYCQKLSPSDECNVMVMGSVDDSGQSKSRVVLLRDFGQDGFTFYTDYNSAKGRQLQNNPKASLLLYWPLLSRQIRIEGKVEKTNRENSKAYFAGRPRQSQISAHASCQSEAIRSRSELEAKVQELEIKYKNQDIECPEHWGGYILRPNYFEFWQERDHRLHDRLCFQKTADNQWETEYLYP